MRRLRVSVMRSLQRCRTGRSPVGARSSAWSRLRSTRGTQRSRRERPRRRQRWTVLVETWFLPLAHDDDFLAPAADEDLLEILHRAYAGVDQAFAGSPFNSFLHRIPGADFHWHIEFQPRVGQVAALELGGDMYINPVLPTDSAARWRGDEG